MVANGRRSMKRDTSSSFSPPIFFFQAEDGIRDYKVTGVQTCALPISQVDAMGDYLAAARSGLKSALLESGLYDDVAQAMVDTWTRSWFRNVGLRVLYVEIGRASCRERV